MSMHDGAGFSEPNTALSDRHAGQRTTMWIFHGERARYASGLFATAEEGLAWAADNRLTGILAEYAVGGAYNVAMREGRFTPSRPHHGTPEHVAAFSPGLRHFHLIDGQPDR
ncbi:hypothetical protein WEI85_29760 [Actinomycetes bacterium KLBMP 9797]